MSLLPSGILNAELNRLLDLEKIVLEPATSHGNVIFHVKINGILVPTCLCDTGARPCVVPKKIADHIGIQAYEETNDLMTMIDGTTTKPLGKVSNVEVVMDRYRLPTDFLVVEIVSSYDVPVIMGRPFIASTGEIVDLVDRSVMFTKLGNIIATKRHIPPPYAVQVFSSPPP